MPTFTIFVFLLGFCSGCKSAAREKVENNCRVIQKPHTKTAARSSWNRVLATNRRSSCPVLQRRAHTHPASFAVSPGSSRRNVEMGSQSELPPHRHTPLHKGRRHEGSLSPIERNQKYCTAQTTHEREGHGFGVLEPLCGRTASDQHRRLSLLLSHLHLVLLCLPHSRIR